RRARSSRTRRGAARAARASRPAPPRASARETSAAATRRAPATTARRRGNSRGAPDQFQVIRSLPLLSTSLSLAPTRKTSNVKRQTSNVTASSMLPVTFHVLCFALHARLTLALPFDVSLQHPLHLPPGPVDPGLDLRD